MKKVGKTLGMYDFLYKNFYMKGSEIRCKGFKDDASPYYFVRALHERLVAGEKGTASSLDVALVEDDFFEKIIVGHGRCNVNLQGLIAMLYLKSIEIAAMRKELERTRARLYPDKEYVEKEINLLDAIKLAYGFGYDYRFNADKNKWQVFDQQDWVDILEWYDSVGEEEKKLLQSKLIGIKVQGGTKRIYRNAYKDTKGKKILVSISV